MRNKKKIRIGKKNYWLKELTIKDIFSLYYSLKAIEDSSNSTTDATNKVFVEFLENRSLFSSITTCPWDELIGLHVSDFKKFYNEFLELNNQFFRKKNNKKDSSKGNFIDNLFSLYCRLVEAGHTDVLAYGYSFFLKAISNHENIVCERVARTAISTRTAQYAEDKEWKRYIRSLIG